MSDEAARKLVKPAHADARIPDPAHPGLDLPGEGAEVPWNHYWIARERQGDVVIVEAEKRRQDEAGDGTAASSLPAPAGVPFMITKAQREQLAKRGFTADEIAHMTPDAAQDEFTRPFADKVD